MRAWITDREFQALCKSPRTAPYRCGPLNMGSLYVLVKKRSDGDCSCSWQWLFTRNGKRCHWGLGPVAEPKKLKDGRQLAEKIVAAYLTEGKDIRVRATLQEKTYAELIPAFIAFKEGLDPILHEHPKRHISRLKLFVPVLGKLPLSQITGALVAQAINEAHVTASTRVRILTDFNAFFRWARSSGYTPKDTPLPTKDPDFGSLIDRSVTVKKHHPCLDWRELPRLVHRLTQRNVLATGTSLALLFLILTCDRMETVRGKPEVGLRGLMWRQIHLDDPQGPLLIVPALNRKVKREDFFIPLSSGACTVLKTIRDFELSDGKPDSLVFPSPLTHKEFSENTLAHLLQRLDAQDIKEGGKGFRDPYQMNKAGVHPVATPHATSRSTFRTWVTENELDWVAAESCLDHKEPSDRYGGAYNRAKIFKRRQALLQQWSDYCLSECEGRFALKKES